MIHRFCGEITRGAMRCGAISGGSGLGGADPGRWLAAG
jgi:hypothetical protein